MLFHLNLWKVTFSFVSTMINDENIHVSNETLQPYKNTRKMEAMEVTRERELRKIRMCPTSGKSETCAE